GVSTGLESKVKSLDVYWFLFPALHQFKCAFHVRSGGTICKVFALISVFTVSNFRAISLVLFRLCSDILGKNSLLCRCCSSVKPVSFANLKAVKKGN
ncbi:hypothetical protein, partial [Vibrio parahaemolyticus]|uniref:hypothetical protein n=1 Tax=Vibrio parahaemolyticus TaxID=670 RepID=UPI001C60335E